MKLSEAQAERIEAAVHDAEAGTTCEIAVGILPYSGDDRGMAAVAGALVFALIVGVAPTIWWNWDRLSWIAIAVVAGARLHPAAIVDLSGERDTTGLTAGIDADAGAAARGVTAPALFGELGYHLEESQLDATGLDEHRRALLPSWQPAGRPRLHDLPYVPERVHDLP